MLQNGANVNKIAGREELTPLHFAVRGDDEDEIVEIVELLLQYKADTEIMDKNGETPLMVATKSGKFHL